MTGRKDNLQLEDLAAELGVSKSTVSRALSGKGRIGSETRKRVLAYAEEHGYAPNSIASSLARSKTNNIAVVIPSEAFSNEVPFFQQCLMGVCEAAARRQYDVLVAPVGEADISVLRRIIANRKVDGVLLTRSLVVDYPADFLKDAGIPFVTVGSSDDDSVIQIDTDTVTACRELTRELLETEKDRIALILGNRTYIVNRNRRAGFVSAFADTQRGKALFFDDVSGGRAVRQAVLAAVEKGAGTIVCGDDFICQKAAEAVLGLPGVRLASFYNNETLRKLAPVQSAVHVDVRSYGITAGEVLLNLLDGKTVERKTFIPHAILRFSH